jgi:chromosome segregation ATPase
VEYGLLLELVGFFTLKVQIILFNRFSRLQRMLARLWTGVGEGHWRFRRSDEMNEPKDAEIKTMSESTQNKDHKAEDYATEGDDYRRDEINRLRDERDKRSKMVYDELYSLRASNRSLHNNYSSLLSDYNSQLTDYNSLLDDYTSLRRENASHGKAADRLGKENQQLPSTGDQQDNQLKKLREEAVSYKEEAKKFMDEARLYKDEATMLRDEAMVFNDEAMKRKEESVKVKEEAVKVKEEAMMYNDEARSFMNEVRNLEKEIREKAEDTSHIEDRSKEILEPAEETDDAKNVRIVAILEDIEDVKKLQEELNEARGYLQHPCFENISQKVLERIMNKMKAMEKTLEGQRMVLGMLQDMSDSGAIGRER